MKQHRFAMLLGVVLAVTSLAGAADNFPLA